MDKRDKILSVTAELITEHGLQSTPMSLIAEQAGVGAGTIYRYFKTKEELVSAVYGDLVHEIGEATLAGYTATAPVKARFLRFWANLFQYFMQHPKQAALFDYLSTSPYMKPELKEQVFSDIFKTLAEIFTEAKEQQLMKEVPIDMASYFVYGALVFLAKKAATQNFAFSEAQVQQVLQMCWDSVRQ